MAYYTVEQTFEYMPSLPDGNLIEAGVFNANCLRRIIKNSVEIDKPFKEVYGMDSWVGLPFEDNKITWLNPDWVPSAFSVQADYGLKCEQECIDFVSNRVWEFVGRENTPPLNFISGFFTESLTAELGQKLSGTASYIHVDVDLYISTVQFISWIFTHNIAKEGCLFRYDDWLYNGQWAGNNRAFAEMTNKYNILWIPLSDNVYIYQKHNI